MDLLCFAGHFRAMAETRHLAFAGRLSDMLRGLCPGQASRRPALFMLEIAAAFVSVLALHDAISGGRAVVQEASVAVTLWAILLAVAWALSFRMAADPNRSLAVSHDPRRRFVWLGQRHSRRYTGG